MDNNFQIKHIKFNSEEYKQELVLRNEVLKKPLGFDISELNLESEINDFHIGLYFENKLIGVLVLTKLNNLDIQMRQVAVDELYRNKNVGKQLVEYSETFLIQLGFKKIVLNARKNVVKFYEKLGYYTIGEEFIEVSIPHFKMEKLLNN